MMAGSPQVDVIRQRSGGTLRVSYGNEIAPLAWCSTHRPPPSSAASRTASRASRGAG